MSNWSCDTYYFGILKSNEEAQEILDPKESWRGHAEYFDERLKLLDTLRFSEMTEDERKMRMFWICHKVEFVGPALMVNGDGRYGCPIPITNDSWDELDKGVVLQKSFYTGDGSVDFRLTVGGEVLLEQRQVFDGHVCHGNSFSWFNGRTPAEVLFFRELRKTKAFDDHDPFDGKSATMQRVGPNIVAHPMTYTEVNDDEYGTAREGRLG